MKLTLGNGNRHEWIFTYQAQALAAGASNQQAFRLSRVQWWTNKKAEVMAEIRESGVEITESAAAEISNYATQMQGPRVHIRPDLQEKLTECHDKIQSNQFAADEYAAWFQVLHANSQYSLSLTHADWLYFFGKGQAASVAQ